MKLFAMCFQVYLTLIDLFFLFAFLLSFLVNIVSFAVLCCRPEHVSNFVDAESFFGPVFRPSVFLLPVILMCWSHDLFILNIIN